MTYGKLPKLNNKNNKNKNNITCSVTIMLLFRIPCIYAL